MYCACITFFQLIFYLPIFYDKKKRQQERIKLAFPNIELIPTNHHGLQAVMNVIMLEEMYM